MCDTLFSLRPFWINPSSSPKLQPPGVDNGQGGQHESASTLESRQKRQNFFPPFHPQSLALMRHLTVLSGHSISRGPSKLSRIVPYTSPEFIAFGKKKKTSGRPVRQRGDRPRDSFSRWAETSSAYLLVRVFVSGVLNQQPGLSCFFKVCCSPVQSVFLSTSLVRLHIGSG